jgi:hypothetical protein
LGFAARFSELLQPFLAFLSTVGLHDLTFRLQHFLSSQIRPLISTLFGLLVYYASRNAVGNFSELKRLNSNDCRHFLA